VPPSGRWKDNRFARWRCSPDEGGFRLRLAPRLAATGTRVSRLPPVSFYRYGFEIYSRLYWTATLLWAR